MDREVRMIPVELRVADEGEGNVLHGVAAVYNTWMDLGYVRERIMPGAFDKALEESDTRAYFNHDRNLILGRVSAGTLRLADSESGLQYDIDLPDTSYANDLRASAKRGDVCESSFAFTVAEDNLYKDDDGVMCREINEVEYLYDVSPVTEPAYDETSASLRSRVEALVDSPLEEAGAEDAGASDSDADEAQARLDHNRRLIDLKERE